jgi:hypothetical protein
MAGGLLNRLRSQWEFIGQVATWLVGSVGGFLQAVPYVYPEQNGSTLSLGSFVVRILVGLLLVPILRFNRRRHTYFWFAATLALLAAGLGAFFRNQDVIAQCVTNYASERVLKGRDDTPWTKEQRTADPNVTDAQLLDRQNVSRRERIWTANSIAGCERDIQIWYVVSLPLFALCIMCLLQTIRCSRARASGAR